MMLVTVFSNKLNKRCFFFILGWGKPINDNIQMHVPLLLYRTSYSHSCNFSWNSLQALWDRLLVSFEFTFHILCHFTMCTLLLYSLYNSCWIKLDDGAIAAFIVPIVAIMLVQFNIATNLQHDVFLDQFHIFGHHAKSIVGKSTYNKK